MEAAIPDGLRSDDIYLFSRIVAAADCYDAMRADRGYRGPIPAAEVLAILSREAGRALDERVVQALLARVNLFPDGEIVRLSDGRAAEVALQNPGDPLHPVVRLVQGDLRTDSPDVLDLSAGGLEIVTIVPEHPPATRDSEAGGA